MLSIIFVTYDKPATGVSVSLKLVSLIVALSLGFTAFTQASDSVTQEKIRINGLYVDDKSDIEDYDTLNYIGLEKAKQ